jgi:hypothetical protein
VYNIFLKEQIMTCAGYDSRTIKLPKAVKCSASTILNTHKRGEFIRSYVQVLISENHQIKNRNFKGKNKYPS